MLAGIEIAWNAALSNVKSDSCPRMSFIGIEMSVSEKLRVGWPSGGVST